MAKEKRALFFIVCFAFLWLMALTFSKNAASQPSMPANISFSGEGNAMYFFDRNEAKIYRYNIQGKLTRVYIINELGKDLSSK